MDDKSKNIIEDTGSRVEPDLKDELADAAKKTASYIVFRIALAAVAIIIFLALAAYVGM